MSRRGEAAVAAAGRRSGADARLASDESDAQRPSRAAIAFALGAIALWSMLASLGVALAHVPPFALTGIALVAGSLPAWPLARRWRVPASTLALGVFGLFGFHFLLFVALRLAPPVQANLVNYLWPLLIVVLAPLFLRGLVWRPAHVVAAGLGFAGAAVAILGADAGVSRGVQAGGTAFWGYAAAFGSALVWASYSLGTRRVRPFPTAAVGLFALVSGLLALACHAAFEPPVALSSRDLLLVAATGLGPLGAAFYLWDAALKRGDPRTIGVVSYATPIASTLLLVVVGRRPLTASIAVAAVLVVSAAILAMRAR